MKKTLSLLILSLLLVGCFSDNADVDLEEDPIVVIKGESGTYSHVLPFESSNVRFSHTGVDYMEIGQGLVKISKEYFPVSSHSIKEGEILNDFRSEFQPLIRYRESIDNPVGLNPSAETVVKVNATTEVSGPIFISDLFEVNFVSTKNTNKLTGAAFAIVLNKTITGDDSRQVTVDDKVLYDFATNIAGPKLESYLRKKPELSGIPIVITLYVVDSGDHSIPGRYIGKAKFENRQGQFEPVNHQWVLFPTNAGRSVDGIINEQISSMKRSLTGFLPEDIGVVAYGEYYDDKLTNLQIKINIQTKTYTEILALSHYAGELIMSFDTKSKVVVEIKSLNKTLAIVKRDANATKAEVIFL
ncbi:MAG TPA: CamS family sex pheromone protein [Erysipelotrichaceae bacterium]|nr:CamS family sex pheromone protein [Erysipelotrichaceae bacterium]